MKPSFKNLLLIAVPIVISCSKKDILTEKLSAQTLAVTTTVNPTPYNVLNLGKIWKLSVPVANAKRAATTISNDSLSHGYSSAFFYTLDSPYTNVVRLWCPVNGATTTPGSGSDHPRTELIESPLLWYTKNQTAISNEVIGGRLEVVLSVKQFSSTGDIIIGQIHGGGTVASGYPFVMLHAKNDSIVAYVKGDTVGNVGTKHYTLLRNITLGTKISFSITDSSNNRIYFKATAAGVTGTWNAAVPANWASVPVHFSAGNYLQDHDPAAAATLGSKVNLYNLKITH